MHVVVITPAEMIDLFARILPSLSAFPEEAAGQLLRYSFRGLLNVHSDYNLHTRGAAKRPFTSKALTTLLPPSPLRLLPGGTNQFPGGSISH